MEDFLSDSSALKRMPFSEHFRELRRRIILSLLAVLLGSIVCWCFYTPIMNWIQAPLISLGERAKLNYQTVGAAFDLKLKVSFYCGIICASPVWIYEIIRFIHPGLRSKEKIYLYTFVPLAIILFTLGVLSGIYMAPRAVEILVSFAPDDSVSYIQSSAYVSFYVRLLIAMGLSFLAPELLLLLHFLGMCSSRRMLKLWRWAVIGSFTFAAIANPLPSPWPMVLQAALLIALYLSVCLVAYLHEKWGAWKGLLRKLAEKMLMRHKKKQ